MEAAQPERRAKAVGLAERPARAASRERGDLLQPEEASPRAQAARAASPRRAVLPARVDRRQRVERQPRNRAERAAQAGRRGLVGAPVAVALRPAVAPQAVAECKAGPVTVAPVAVALRLAAAPEAVAAGWMVAPVVATRFQAKGVARLMVRKR